MGVASRDTIELVVRNNKEEIEEVKKNIKNLREKSPSDCFSIIFKLMNGKNITITCFQNTKLFDVFLLLIDKARDSNYTNLDKLKMYYNSVDITNYFTKESDKDVSFLKLNSFNPIININI